MKKKQLTPSQFSQVVDDHAAATQGRTPVRARQALLAGARDVAGLTIHPVTLATQILLEDINHPVLQVAKADSQEAASAIQIGARDVLHLIYIFAHPEEAWRTIGLSRENFLAAARDFGFSVAPAVVAEVIPVIRDMLFKSGRTLPGSPSEESGGDGPLDASQPQPQG